MNEMEVVRKITHMSYLFRKENGMMKDVEHNMRHRDIMMLDAILKIKKDGDLVKMSEISTYFQITPAAVSQCMKNFERKGWVERILLDSDRRSVYIKVSDEAKKLMEQCETHITQQLMEFITLLGEEDAEAFLRILEKAIEFSKEHKPPMVNEKGDLQ